MKIKTNKLRKLEKERKSILTDDLKKCYICNGLASEIHEVYGGANRVQSIKNDLCVPICRSCHREITNNNNADLILKQICQREFERQKSHDEFMKIIGRNWL